MATPAPNPAVARIVALVMERLKVPTAQGLAKKLEMPPYSEGSVSLVRRWIRGQHGPSFDYTMLMLSKAGLLTPEADRVWRGEGFDPAAEVRAAAAGAEEAAGQAEQLAPGERARRARGNR